MANTATSDESQRGLAERVAYEIRQGLVETSGYPQGRLPSHRELCRCHQVSLNTIRKALDILEQDGVVYRRERSGTFLRPDGVRPEKPQLRANLKCINFIEEYPPTWPVLKADYAAGYTEALDDLDLKMRFVHCPAGFTDYASLISDRFALSEQGCVLVTVHPPGLMRWLDAQGIPFVVQYYSAYKREGLPEHHSVFVNKLGAGFDLASHLIGLGHERIGFIGFKPDDTHALDLYEGYRAALLTKGLQPDPRDFLEFHTNEPDMAVKAARDYLERASRPTAVMAQNDAVALGLLRAAADLGLSVPQDMSVVGFNDLPEAAMSDPPLTTVSSPRRLLGRQAVETLIAAANGEYSERQTRILGCHLVVRQSAAAPLG